MPTSSDSSMSKHVHDISFYGDSLRKSPEQKNIRRISKTNLKGAPINRDPTVVRSINPLILNENNKGKQYRETDKHEVETKKIVSPVFEQKQVAASQKLIKDKNVQTKQNEKTDKSQSPPSLNSEHNSTNLPKSSAKQNEKTNKSQSPPSLNPEHKKTNLSKPSAKGNDDETVTVLKALSRTLGTDGIRTVSHMVKSELCPCCKCMICKCRANQTNQTNLTNLTNQTNRIDYISKTKGDIKKKILAVEMAYSWTFDYFVTPDLESYERERQARFERERLLAEEEEIVSLFEEMLRQQGLNTDETLRGVQAREILEKIKEMIISGTFSTGQQRPPIPLKKSIESSTISTKTRSIDKFKQNKEGSHNVDNKKNLKNMNSEQTLKEKASEQKSIHPEMIEKSEFAKLDAQPSVSPSVKNAAVPVDSKQSAKNQGSTVPSAQQPIIHKSLPNMRKTKRKKKLQKSLSEQRSQKIKRMSYKESFSASRESAQWGGRPNTAPEEEKSRKEDKFLTQDSPPRSRSHFWGANEVENGHGFVDWRDKSAEHTEESRRKSTKSSSSLVQLSSKVVLALQKAAETAKETVQTRKLKLHPSMRHYTDICNCLPGACTCGSHYIFQTLKEPIHIPDESSGSSCLCIHTFDEVEEEEEGAEGIMPDSHFDLIPRPETPIKQFMLCPKKRKYEKTVIIVKPEAMKFKDVILRAIKKEGLDLIDERLLQLTPEQVTEIYNENYGSAYFLMFVKQMSSTPVWVLSVAGISAIERWKNLIGEDETIHSTWFYPESIKRRFGLYSDIYGAMKSSSDSQEAKKDLQYFFPLDILEPIAIDSTEVQDYCDKYIHPTLLKALYRVVTQKPKDPLMYLAEWVLKNNPNIPSFPDPILALAPT